MSGPDALLAVLLSAGALSRDPIYQGVAAAFVGVIFCFSGAVKVCKPLAAAWSLVDFGVARRPWPALGYLLGGSWTAPGFLDRNAH